MKYLQGILAQYNKAELEEFLKTVTIKRQQNEFTVEMQKPCKLTYKKYLNQQKNKASSSIKMLFL